jgi:DNA-binding transcriptional regulator YiaG
MNSTPITPSRIRRHRGKVRNQSQAEAAREVGVAVRTWQGWEAGTSIPQPRHRRALLIWLRTNDDALDGAAA